MRFLILGGTAWLGGHIARAALERGHHVTCLARGSSGSAPGEAVFVPTDRTRPDAYKDVMLEPWDAVVDVSRQPGQVAGAVDALADRAAFFVFVSSSSVYADQRTPGADEDSPVLPALDADVMEGMDTYGEAKVACEQHVRRGFGPSRALIARPGLIGGPGDESDRTGYWPLRFARPATPEGSVLVPDAPDLATQVLDVRDLAAWLVDGGAQRVAGAFNATGDTVSFSEHIATARRIGGHAGAVVLADEHWLVQQGVEPWMGARSLPLWLDKEWAGLNARSSNKARNAGLTTRPLQHTLADVLRWELTRKPGRPRQAGLSDQDERDLLTSLTRS